MGKCKTVLIIITLNSEHSKNNQNISKDMVYYNDLFFMRALRFKTKPNQIPKLILLNCFMFRLIPSLQSRCNVHWLIHFTFEHPAENGCAVPINAYKENAPTASVSRTFHPGLALIRWCMHLIQHRIFPPSPLVFFLNLI